VSKGFFWHDDAEDEFEEQVQEAKGALVAQAEFAVRQLCEDSQVGPRRGPTCGRVQLAFVDVQVGSYCVYFAEGQLKRHSVIVGLHFAYSPTGAHTEDGFALSKRRLARTRL